jgi:hypothetical protein
MLEAKLDGKSIQAGPGSPEVAQCPACAGAVRKRKRKSGRDGYTYFYRHQSDDGNSV